MKEVAVRVTHFADKKHSVLFKSDQGWSIYVLKGIMEKLGNPKNLVITFRPVEE